MTYYETLGIQKDASRNDVKRAYFTLVKKYPPEKNPEEFKRIRKAYEILYDDSERSVYDGVINLPEEYADIYNAGCIALKKDYYDDVIGELKAATEERPDLYALSELLGRIYIENDNSGSAVKIFERLVSIQPENAGYRAKLAESYLKRGFYKKALAEYGGLIIKDKTNAALWAGLCEAHKTAGNFETAKQMLSNGFAAVEKSGGDVIELNIAAVRLYITDEKGYGELQKHIGILTERFEQEPALTQFLLLSLKKIVSKRTFKKLAAEYKNDLRPIRKNIITVLKLLSKIEPDKELEELIEHMVEDEILGKIKNDENVPEFAFVLTDVKMSGDEDEPDGKIALAIWESECLWDIENSRKGLKYFRENYPEQYALNKTFYDRVLDPKKERRLCYETYAKTKALNKKYPGLFSEMTGGGFDGGADDSDEFDTPGIPFRRDTPKVGRNDPCPCGSGKKYKKCCGA